MPGRMRIDRGADRAITFGGVILAASLLGLAVASLALPPAARLGIWLPLHLALAGGAATAIAALLPFFVATLAVAPPAPTELRVGAIALIAGGAVTAALAHALGEDRAAAAGGVAYVLGLGLVGVAAFVPVRRALGPRRRLVERAYALAIADVVVGGALATGFLGGERAILAAWGSLKPAHAWLNLFGFVTLVIAATLVHLAPTISGSRIRPRRSVKIAVLAFAVAAPVVALGFASRSDLIAGIGALIAIGGAISLAIHGMEVGRDRAAWTTDAGWHRFTEGSLVAGPTWLVVATLIAGGRVMDAGAAPDGWSFGVVAGPLIAGFVVQVLVGAWTHLAPAIGPGHPADHARRRGIVGRGGPLRLLAWNAAVATLTVAALADQPGAAQVVSAAVVTLGALMAVSLGLLAAAFAPRAVAKLGR